MAQSIRGREIHSQSLAANEAGEYLKALQFADEAMLSYADDNDLLGFAEIHAMRSLTLRALADKKDSKSFLWSALGEMEAMVKMARQSEDKTSLALPVFNLAKTYERLGEVKKACDLFEEALELIENFPPEGYANRRAVINDFKMHLATAKYSLVGDEALLEAEKSLEELNNSSDPDQYSFDVWRSGGYMRLAQFLWDKGEKDKSALNLAKAKEIIDSNAKLTARAEQWQKLSKKLN